MTEPSATTLSRQVSISVEQFRQRLQLLRNPQYGNPREKVEQLLDRIRHYHASWLWYQGQIQQLQKDQPLPWYILPDGRQVTLQGYLDELRDWMQDAQSRESKLRQVLRQELGFLSYWFTILSRTDL